MLFRSLLHMHWPSNNNEIKPLVDQDSETARCVRVSACIVGLHAYIVYTQADGGWCLSWCKDRYWGEILAVGCGVNGIIKVRCDILA